MNVVHWWNDTESVEAHYSEETSPNATVFVTNPAWNGVGANPRLQDDKPATDHLNHGRSLKRRVIIMKIIWIYLLACGNAALLTKLTCSHNRLLAAPSIPGLRFTIVSSAALRLPSWLNSSVGWLSSSTDTFRRYLRMPANTVDRFTWIWTNTPRFLLPWDTFKNYKVT
jgi:hypothetical protein